MTGTEWDVLFGVLRRKNPLLGYAEETQISFTQSWVPVLLAWVWNERVLDIKTHRAGLGDKQSTKMLRPEPHSQEPGPETLPSLSSRIQRSLQVLSAMTTDHKDEEINTGLFYYNFENIDSYTFLL